MNETGPLSNSMSRRGARAALRAFGTLAFVLTFSAMVNAAPPHVFAPGDKLASADLNQNFSDLNGRVSNLEAPPAFLQSVSSAPETAGGLGEPHAYSAIAVMITPGTWLIEAHATIFTTMSTDGVQLGLRNVTTSADIEPSRSGAVQTTAASSAVALSTTAVVSVGVPTAIQMKAYPNGSSVVNFGSTVLTGFAAQQRLSAVKLR